MNSAAPPAPHEHLPPKRIMDAQTARDRRTKLIVAIDQEPFFGGANLFCLARPLVVEESGEPVDLRTFRNRERVWWLVDQVPPAELVPGTLHVASIEDARVFEQDDPEKDKYQISRNSRQPSSEHWAQVIDVDRSVPGIDQLFDAGVPAAVRPFKRIFFRFLDGVLGPFHAEWESESGRLIPLSPRSGGAKVARISRERLASDEGRLVLDFVVGKYDRNSEAGTREARAELIRTSSLEGLVADGSPVDAVPLDEVAENYARQLRSKDYKRPLHDDPLGRLEAMLDKSSPTEQERFARFKDALATYEAEGPDTERISQRPKYWLKSFVGAPASSEAPASPKKAPVSEAKAETPGAPAVTEADFTRRLIEGTAAAGYRFSDTDLIAFHMALKASPMVVLAGRSGVGKSTLPRLYARALGAPEDLLLVSVRPDWMDDRDVMGAFDPLSQRYLPAPTGLVEFLRDSARGEARDRTRIVLLDEMNLARVEYYFASFLSALEQPTRSRGIRLFSPEVTASDDPFADCAWLPIPDNVRFVGTVNVDETTHFFSPKVLDRVAVQSFAAPDLRNATQSIDEDAFELSAPLPHAVWRSWIGARESVEPWVAEQLVQVDELLCRIRSGLGHRTLHRCLDFVAGSEGLGAALPRRRALDLAIQQFVLPRLRADQPDFGEVAAALLELLPESDYPRTHEVLTRLADEGGAVDYWDIA